jgi:exodeoxyribonuclease VII small subunit
MAEESYSFAQARTRLEEIVGQVRKKDTSLEKSLDLLEEGVRLANQCTELIDHADWEAAGAPVADEGESADVVADESVSPDSDAPETAEASEPQDGE